MRPQAARNALVDSLCEDTLDQLEANGQLLCIGTEFRTMTDTTSKTSTRILLVGLGYALPNADCDEFYSDTHFLDYDIVIMDPKGALSSQTHEYPVDDGVLRLKSKEGHRFYRRYTSIAQKLVEYVNRGGLAVVFLRHMPELHYSDYTGGFETEVIEDLNKQMPWGKDTIQRRHGSNIDFITKGSFGRFWNNTRDLWSYQAVYVKTPERTPLAHVKGYTDQVVANFVMTTKRGFAIITPILSFKSGAHDGEAAEEARKRFIEAIITLYHDLQVEPPAPKLPDWASDYHLPGETQIRDEIDTASEQIDTLQEEIIRRTEMLDELSSHKLLFTAHDSALEAAVDRVLTDLGMKVEPGPKGRVDRVAIFGERKLAIEVQGIKKGAKEDHARSLTQWVQEIARQDGKEPKGLLIVNPYRETPPKERTANLWPGKTLEICEHQGHCAMTGTQLLGLYFDAMADEKKRTELIECMFSTNGLFKYYQDWQACLGTSEDKKIEQS